MGLNHNFIIYISKITIALMASICPTKAISAETKNCDGGGIVLIQPLKYHLQFSIEQESMR